MERINFMEAGDSKECKARATGFAPITMRRAVKEPRARSLFYRSSLRFLRFFTVDFIVFSGSNVPWVVQPAETW